jgi:hypothetical protein
LSTLTLECPAERLERFAEPLECFAERLELSAGSLECPAERLEKNYGLKKSLSTPFFHILFTFQ